MEPLKKNFTDKKNLTLPHPSFFCMTASQKKIVPRKHKYKKKIISFINSEIMRYLQTHGRVLHQSSYIYFCHFRLSCNIGIDKISNRSPSHLPFPTSIKLENITLGQNCHLPAKTCEVKAFLSGM